MCAEAAIVEAAPRPVVRPSIPPLAWLAAGTWVGVVAAEAVAWRVFGGGLPECAAWAMPLLAAAAVAASARLRRHGATLLVAGALAGCAAGGASWHAWRHDEAAVSAMRGELTLATATDVAPGKFGPSVVGTLADATGRRWRVLARFGDSADSPELGMQMAVRGSPKQLSRDDRGRAFHRKGIVGTISVRSGAGCHWAPGIRGVISRARYRCVRLIAEVPGDAGALLSGVLLGDRRRLTGTQAERDFRTAGLTHLVAVSGSHLVVVGALIAWVLARTRARRSLSTAAVLATMCGYVVATGVQASAIRALVMAGVAVGSVSGGRRADRAAALAGAAAVALVVWPPVAFDLGFQLSVASVAGLLLFARFGGAWLGAAVPRVLVPLAEPLSLTLVAQAMTFPIAAPVFGVVSLVAPLANLLVGPLVATMLTVGLAGLGASALNVSVGGVVLRCAGSIASLSVWIAGHLASLPAASVPVGTWGPAVSVVVGALVIWAWVVWPPPERWRARLACAGAALLTAIAAAGPPARPGAEVVVLDVGQGDAILIRDGSHAALVDTGPDPTALRTALARHGIRGLEFVGFTHSHDDHTGGAEALMGSHRVFGVVSAATGEAGAYQEIAEGLHAPCTGLVAGQTLAVGSVTVTVVWPRQPVADVGENAASLVLLVEHDDRTVLLAGDAEGDVLDPLLRAGALRDVDVLKVGHHGSRVSLTPATLGVLRPEVAVISVGAGNRFGHPTQEALEMLRQAGAEVLRTDLEGDVVIPLDKIGATPTHQ